jgi:hypothetical protein
MADAQRTAAQALGASLMGLGLIGLARPARAAALRGVDESVARNLGLRDLQAGFALLRSRDPRAAFVSTATLAVGDAARYGRNSRKVLAGSLAIATVSLAVLVRSRSTTASIS